MSLNPKINMNCSKFNRLCKLCSYRSIENKQYGKIRNGESNTKTFQTTDNGLICSSCNGLTCSVCMKLLIPFLQKNKDKHANNDLLHAYMNAVEMLPSPILTPAGFIGHCCNIDDYNVNVPTNVIHKNATVTDSMKSPSVVHDGRLSGCIYFPEFQLFVDSPLDCTDIHALGAEKEVTAGLVPIFKKGKFRKNDGLRSRIYLPARWHCVILDDYARSNNDISPHRNGMLPKNWNCKFLSKIKISMPQNEDIVEKVCCQLGALSTDLAQPYISISSTTLIIFNPLLLLFISSV